MTGGPLAILHTEASSGWGGQEIRILTETAGLRERGHRVAILCRPDSRLAHSARESGLPTLTDPMPFALDPRTIGRTVRLLRRFRPQVLVTHSSIDSWCGGVAARLLRLPIVRVRHLSVPVGPHPATRFVYRALCDRVITTGEAIRTHLVREIGLPEAKVRSVPTGIDVSRFDPRKADGARVRAAFGIGPKTPLVGIVATLRDWKGHRFFLQAMARLRDRLPTARGLIVGDGPQRKNITRWLAEWGLERTVILAGYREDIPDILAGLDVLASASTGSEGVPQILLQGLAMERPIVATTVGAVSEIIRDGETGTLVPPRDSDRLADAIAAVLQDPARFQALGARGGRWVRERWTLGRMLDDMEDVYARLASAPW
jgi:glycosyltransferase involved in cell wall biosynthesis